MPVAADCIEGSSRVREQRLDCSAAGLVTSDGFVMIPTALPSDPVLRDRLLAILAADAAGYSRLMELEERATLAALEAARDVFREHIARHGGRVVDMAGDSVLAVFGTTVGAVEAALSVQRQLQAAQTGTAEDRRLRFRIGVHIGDVIEKPDGSVYGDGVNIAARLQSLAEPGSLAISQAVCSMVSRRVEASFDDIGEQVLKSIAQPVRAYRLRQPGLRFGRFELRTAERRLLVDGKTVDLQARALDLLLALAEQPGQLIDKQSLVDRVWPGNALEDVDIVPQLNALRELFGGEIVATVPGRGYRFEPPVAALSSAAPALAPAAPPGRTELPTQPAPPALRTHLPAELPPLLGRADELAALGLLIDRHRLVTIVGAGGMGKTRLAQTLLATRRDAYAHGICWVELASISDGSLLPGSIAAALGIELGSADPRAGLLSALAPLTLLVALDNVEQLLGDMSLLAGELHDAAPGLRIVVTSQAPLQLAAEQVYRIGGLAVPQGPLGAALALNFGAVALFTERAMAADARFRLTDANAPAVIELCRALDGLALAIELAAARAPMLGVQRLAASMQDRLKLLTTSRNRAAPARQQTLRAALDWSHGFLNPREQAVFRRLSVMAGSASLELVQQVVVDAEATGELDEWAVLDALGVLIDRSLVAVLAGSAEDDAAAPRYRLLDSPRAFALERLGAAGETESLRRRHALAVAALYDAAWDAYFSGAIGHHDWMHQLAADQDNAREALAFAATADAAATVLAIGATLLRALPRSLHAERSALADRCAALVDGAVPPRLQQRALLQLSIHWGNTQKLRSRELAQRALQLARQLHAGTPDDFLLYFALCREAIGAARIGQADAATAAIVELRALEDPGWPPQRLLWGVEAECHVASALGHAADALRHNRRLVELDQARGAHNMNGLASLIDYELAAGDCTSAVKNGSALVAALEGTREEYALAFARLNLTGAWLQLGDCVAARQVALAGWPQAARFEMQGYWADYLALLAALEARPQAAARLAGYADAAYNAHQDSRQVNEEAAVERARVLARAVLGEAECERLQREGGGMNPSDFAGLAFASK